MGNLLNKLKELFQIKKIEICMVGLENSGKSTLLNQLQMGEALQTAPTIGLNVKNIKKGGVFMKVWDIGAQFRPEWGKYATGCDIIIFMIDSSNALFIFKFPLIFYIKKEAVPIAKKEMYQLLDNQNLNGIPLLILGNKIDLEPHLNEYYYQNIQKMLIFVKRKEIIEGMNLDYLFSNSWVVIMISALKGINIQEVIEWMIKKSKQLKQ